MAAMIDPVGLWNGPRYFAIVLGAVSSVLAILFNRRSLALSKLVGEYICLFAIVLPLVGLLVWSIRTSSAGFGGDTSYFAAAAITPLAVACCSKSAYPRVLNLFILTSRIFSISIMALFLYTSITSNEDLVYELIARGVMFFGERNYGGVSAPYFYFVSTPLLIPLMCHDVQKALAVNSIKYNFYALFTAFCLVISGPRAFWFSIVLIGALTILVNRKFYGKIKLLLMSAPILIAILFFSIDMNQVWKFGYDVLSLNTGSNQQKILMLGSYGDILLSDPIVILTGQGFNAVEWSEGLSKIVAEKASRTELTYFELIRVFGLPVGFYCIYFFLRVVFKLRFVDSEYKWLLPSMIIVLVISIQNPYLFSTNGFIPLSLAVGTLSVRMISDKEHESI